MIESRKSLPRPSLFTRRNFLKLSSVAPALSIVSAPFAGLKAAGLSAEAPPEPMENREELRTVIPAEIDGPIPNPYMGWGLWTGAYNDFISSRYGEPLSVEDNTTKFPDDAPLFNWVMLDWPWAKVEPTEGKFEWDDFDAIVKYWSARDKQFLVRFWVTDDPGWNGKPGGIPCPDWIWQKGLRYREYVGNGGVKRREPDYADPSYEQIYLPALGKLLKSFAARYDHPGTPVALLQVMGYGHWADFGTWIPSFSHYPSSHYPWPSARAEHDVLSKLMSLYIQNFRHIHLFETGYGGSREWDRTLQDRLYLKALDIAVEHHFGLIWTGFIDALSGWDRDIKDRYWRQDPIIAEGNWCYEDMVSQKIHGTTMENLDVALEWHSNYSHFYTDAIAYKLEMAQDRPFLERGLEQGGLGYRLVPTSLAWPSAVPAGNLLVMRQNWVNRNVGRLYVQHPLKLYLTDVQGTERFSEVDSSFDEREWVRGETYSLISVFHLPKDLTPGSYDVRIALVDEKGKPRIALGIEGRDADNRYKVGEVQILPYDGPAGCGEAYCP